MRRGEVVEEITRRVENKWPHPSYKIYDTIIIKKKLSELKPGRLKNKIYIRWMVTSLAWGCGKVSSGGFDVCGQC